MIDDQLALRTPEGITLYFSPAGPVPRFCAFFIDLLIQLCIFLGLSIITSKLEGIGEGIMLISLFILIWFYPVLFEIFSNGQTPGKKAMGLVVVHRNGSPITVNGSILRNLLLTADFLPIFYFAGLISMLLGKHFQRLGDLAADTMVIHLVKNTASDAAVHLDELVPDWPVTREDQVTLVSFLERGAKLTQARRQELAILAWPECPPEQAEQKALSTAKHLVGDS